MELLLDTSILLALEKGDQEALAKLNSLRASPADALSIASPTYSEFYSGVLAKKPAAREAALEYLDSFELLNTGRGSSIILAGLRYRAKSSGRNLPIMDLMIASIAIDRGMTLVTRDRHFEGIEGLEVVVVV